MFWDLIDDRVDEPNRTRIKRGILSSADRNLLYIDEVNLLNDEIVDVILDASAQGGYTVRRGQFFSNLPFCLHG